MYSEAKGYERLYYVVGREERGGGGRIGVGEGGKGREERGGR